MPANVHPTTGIPYGVTSANWHADLASDIMSNGKDLTLADQEDAISSRITGMLDDFESKDVLVDPGVDRRDAFEEHWASVIRTTLDLSNREANRVAGAVADLSDMDSFTFDIGEVHGEVLRYLRENDYFSNDDTDGHEYAYESGGIEYRMGTLGGAYLIWVCRSPYVTYAATCSPCVPNAGDLDNPTSDAGGAMCYCLDPGAFNEDNKDIWPRQIMLVQPDGAPGEIVWEHPDLGATPGS